ncbi:MAG: ATP-binding protein [Anaerolineaceae bacterium]|nr:ATP-binding protein [Anaerolineaceae bacterium]
MKAWFKTLRVRIALWIAVAILGALLFLGIYIYLSISTYLKTIVDQNLLAHAGQAIVQMEFIKSEVIIPSPSPNDTGSDPDHDSDSNSEVIESLANSELTVRYLDTNGKVLDAFGPDADIFTDSTLKFGANLNQAFFKTLPSPDSDQPIRIYSSPVHAQGKLIGFVQVGQALTLVNATQNSILEILLIGIPILALLFALVGYILAGRALAPIAQITKTARDISEHDLSRRLSVSQTSDEVGQLALTFNAMLARLEASFERGRRFTAEASHDLRNPLATMLAIIETTLGSTRTQREYKAALSDLGEEVERLRQSTEKLLLQARGLSSSVVIIERINFSVLTQTAVDNSIPLAARKGLLVSSQIPSGLFINGNQADLARLLQNLLDNAVKFTERGDIQLSLQICQEQAGYELIISDTGIGIPVDNLPFIFDRYYKGGNSQRKDGSGLGLTIAREIVQAHRGNIRAESILGNGTKITVFLPLENN